MSRPPLDGVMQAFRSLPFVRRSLDVEWRLRSSVGWGGSAGNVDSAKPTSLVADSGSELKRSYREGVRNMRSLLRSGVLR
jgi:hypothetical protein